MVGAGLNIKLNQNLGSPDRIPAEIGEENENSMSESTSSDNNEDD
jgi:hypothetical protein